jgi:hypothetical protein
MRILLLISIAAAAALLLWTAAALSGKPGVSMPLAASPS